MSANAIYLNYDERIRVEKVDVRKPGEGLHYSSAPPIDLSKAILIVGKHPFSQSIPILYTTRISFLY
ncbi:hypothetical protein EYC80_008185 [Monilinia laxa]|uniref:Uncharacterized protein n=1 Tax=Monilinia laxa TaxID=61186 RepID=A0A5N6JTS4_MONLA|nr:hypothetical protein EYC80_008185 [Monilinia laxa]